jgi:hypothetical protein
LLNPIKWCMPTDLAEKKKKKNKKIKIVKKKMAADG